MLIALAQLGFPIIFFIVFGDVCGELIERMGAEEGSFWTSRWFTQSLLGVILLYLNIQKQIHKLRYTGLIILGLCLTFMILFLIHFLTTNPHPEPRADLFKTEISIKFFTGFPVMIASYAFQPSFFTVFASLRTKTHLNGQLADFYGRILLFIIYVTSPLLAYGLYGANIQNNLLK